MQKIERTYKRRRFIRKRVVFPDSHTEIHLTNLGKEALSFLTEDLDPDVKVNREEGVIYIMHSCKRPEHIILRKIIRLLNDVTKRLQQVEEIKDLESYLDGKKKKLIQLVLERNKLFDRFGKMKDSEIDKFHEKLEKIESEINNEISSIQSELKKIIL